VTVRASANGALCIDVIDKGVGIVSTDIPHIFERFRQVNSSSTREHGGTGVGLYLCAQLVRAHGGEIGVDSTWGKGSTFAFSLPRRELHGRLVRLRAAAAGG
jgi:two-component system phosphate regulon sensor histidine kinase PhoR